jgi:hypothetical protein
MTYFEANRLDRLKCDRLTLYDSFDDHSGDKVRKPFVFVTDDGQNKLECLFLKCIKLVCFSVQLY